MKMKNFRAIDIELTEEQLRILAIKGNPLSFDYYFHEVETTVDVVIRKKATKDEKVG